MIVVEQPMTVHFTSCGRDHFLTHMQLYRKNCPGTPESFLVADSNDFPFVLDSSRNETAANTPAYNCSRLHHDVGFPGMHMGTDETGWGTYWLLVEGAPGRKEEEAQAALDSAIATVETATNAFETASTAFEGLDAYATDEEKTVANATKIKAEEKMTKAEEDKVGTRLMQNQIQ